MGTGGMFDRSMRNLAGRMKADTTRIRHLGHEVHYPANLAGLFEGMDDWHGICTATNPILVR